MCMNACLSVCSYSMYISVRVCEGFFYNIVNIQYIHNIYVPTVRVCTCMSAWDHGMHGDTNTRLLCYFHENKHKPTCFLCDVSPFARPSKHSPRPRPIHRHHLWPSMWKALMGQPLDLTRRWCGRPWALPSSPPSPQCSVSSGRQHSPPFYCFIFLSLDRN